MELAQPALMVPVARRGFYVRVLELFAAGLMPAALFFLVKSHPSIDPYVVVPTQHFLIVSTVSLLALVVACLVTFSALRIQQYRVLFLGLGFMSMAGLFAVHALSTPGIFSNPTPASPALISAAPAAGGYGAAAYAAAPEPAAASYAGDYGGYGSYAAPVPAAYSGADSDDGHSDAAHKASVVGLTALLSLLVPAAFFALSYSRLGTPLGWRIPFRPMALVIAVGVALLSFAVVALARSAWFANDPLLQGAGPAVAGWLTVLLLAFCIWRQFLVFRTTRLPLQGALIIAFLLLMQAVLSMQTADTWSLAWWEYHALMLAACCVSLGTIMYEYRRGQPIRRVLEGAMELQVEVGLELECVEAIAMLAAATEAKDPDTKGHTVRVAEVAVAIGRAMDLPYETLRTLARAGLLHDIGKIMIPDEVLLKPGPLDDREWVIMKQHPSLGLDILRKIGSLEREAQVLIAHHERWSGEGYPLGIAGEEIPLEARIISVADTFDALVSDRPYRRGLSREAALEILRRESGSHLYPPAVDAFLRSFDRGMLGDLVDGIYRRAA